MLHCIWHKTLGERVVESEEFHKLLATGDYYKTPWDAKKARDLGDKHEKVNERSRHNLHSASAKTRDDIGRANSESGSDGLQREDGEHGTTRAGVRAVADKGAGRRVSSKVKDETADDPSRENDQSAN